MRIPIAGVLVCTLFASCIRVGGTSDAGQRGDTPLRQMLEQEPELTKARAVKIAEGAAEKTYGGLEQFTVLPCDQHEFWRVSFEPKIGTTKNIGPEYLIDKKTGSIVGKNDLPFRERGYSKMLGRSQKIEREDAIKIASRDASTAYGTLENFDLTVCEFTNTWRVIYSVKDGLNGGGPEYVIGKLSGDIIGKKYYQ